MCKDLLDLVIFIPGVVHGPRGCRWVRGRRAAREEVCCFRSTLLLLTMGNNILLVSEADSWPFFSCRESAMAVGSVNVAGAFVTALLPTWTPPAK